MIHNMQKLLQMLVQWEGLPSYDNTYEDVHLLHQQYPFFFDLEDKVYLYKEGNVMTMISFPYMVIKMASDLDWSKVNKIKGSLGNVDKSTSTQGKGEYSREES